MHGRPWAMPSTRPAGAEPYNPERPAASARQQEDLTTLGVPPGCRCCALARHIQLTHAACDLLWLRVLCSSYARTRVA